MIASTRSGWPAAEVVERLALAGPAPRLGHPDHPVERHQPGEALRAGRLERVHPAHAEARSARRTPRPVASAAASRSREVAIVVELGRRRPCRGSALGRQVAPGERLDGARRPSTTAPASRAHEVVEQRPQAEEVGRDDEAHRRRRRDVRGTAAVPDGRVMRIGRRTRPRRRPVRRRGGGCASSPSTTMAMTQAKKYSPPPTRPNESGSGSTTAMLNPAEYGRQLAPRPRRRRR